MPTSHLLNSIRRGEGRVTVTCATPSLYCSAIKEESHGDLQQEWLIDHSATLCIWCCTNLRRNKDLPQEKEPMLSQKDEVPS
jgi:hypothetical protein